MKWIPMSERLPKNGHYYLWCSDMGSVQSDYYWDGFEKEQKYGYNIVAWMPLPRPYTADRKTENSSEKPNNSTISKMEQVEWTKEDCKGCKYNEYPYDSGTCFVRVCINGNKYEPKDEPQTKRPIQCYECRAWHRCFKEKPSYNMIKSRCPIDEPQTERSSE